MIIGDRHALWAEPVPECIPTLYTLHFTLYTLHFTLYTLNFTLYTLNSTLYTLHSTLYTLNILNGRSFLMMYAMKRKMSSVLTMRAPQKERWAFANWIPMNSTMARRV